jgi:hypothetical protein
MSVTIPTSVILPEGSQKWDLPFADPLPASVTFDFSLLLPRLNKDLFRFK